jgi:electron transfer flavoprotein alpha subunit
MTYSKKILVVGELSDGNVPGITGELLGVGRRLADVIGAELAVLFFGSDIGETVKHAFAQGADSIYAADDPYVEDYKPEIYADTVVKLCNDMTPSALILGATRLGRDLAPRVGLKSGLASDCVDLNIDSETGALIATRPVYGGKALAEVDCGATLPAMATVRPKFQEALPIDSARTGEVTMVSVDAGSGVARTRVVDRCIIEVKGMRLEDARIVVGGGRGLGSIENWSVLEALADDLKGDVGATRGACDEGYCNTAIQIGISSKRIAPELYIAVAIS